MIPPELEEIRSKVTQYMRRRKHLPSSYRPKCKQKATILSITHRRDEFGLTIREICEYLTLDIQILYHWLHQENVKAGRVKKISKAELRRDSVSTPEEPTKLDTDWPPDRIQTLVINVREAQKISNILPPLLHKELHTYLKYLNYTTGHRS